MDENAPQIRVSDADRDEVAQLLNEHAAVGRLTLAEHEERVELAFGAKTRGELDRLLADLPATSGAARSAVDMPVRRKVSRWLVAIMGGSHRRGRFRLSGSVNTLAIMGGDDVDLREAEIDGDEVVINAYAFMGGTDIYVPDTVEVIVEGIAIMGGNDERGSRRSARKGAPVIRVRAYAFMGGIDIWRLPAETRELSLREAKQAARQLERGSR